MFCGLPVIVAIDRGDGEEARQPQIGDDDHHAE